MLSQFNPHTNGTKVTDSALVWAQLWSTHHPMQKEKTNKQKEVSILVMLLSHFTGRT